jgi:hypothetical protein
MHNYLQIGQQKQRQPAQVWTALHVVHCQWLAASPAAAHLNLMESSGTSMSLPSASSQATTTSKCERQAGICTQE